MPRATMIVSSAVPRLQMGPINFSPAQFKMVRPLLQCPATVKEIRDDSSIHGQQDLLETALRTIAPEAVVVQLDFSGGGEEPWLSPYPGRTIANLVNRKLTDSARIISRLGIIDVNDGNQLARLNLVFAGRFCPSTLELALNLIVLGPSGKFSIYDSQIFQVPLGILLEEMN